MQILLDGWFGYSFDIYLALDPKISLKKEIRFITANLLSHLFVSSHFLERWWKDGVFQTDSPRYFPFFLEHAPVLQGKYLLFFSLSTSITLSIVHFLDRNFL